MDTLGQRVRVARTQKLMLQRDVAEATGITEATLSRIETDKGVRAPRLSTVRKIASALDVPPEWLLFGDQAKKSPARRVRAGDQTPDTGSYPGRVRVHFTEERAIEPPQSITVAYVRPSKASDQ